RTIRKVAQTSVALRTQPWGRADDTLGETAHMPGPFFGQPHKRLEDERLLRGEGTFVDDLRLVGMLHVAYVRSIHAHARFRVAGAAGGALPGVVAVCPGAALEGEGGVLEIPTVVDPPALRPCRQPALAREKVRYVGEPIAAVVAADRYVAEDAAASVTIEY